MIDNKRKVRTYKAADGVYKKSLKRAKKEKTSLAKQIETWLSWYAAGNNILISSHSDDSVSSAWK
jgi:hypothetical protein